MTALKQAAKKITFRAAVCGLAGMVLGASSGYFVALGAAGPTATVVAVATACIGLHEGFLRGRLWDLRAERRHAHGA